MSLGDRLIAGAPVLVLFMGACGDGELTPAESEAFVSRDSAGVELLVSRPDDTPRESGWTVGPEPTVVFGAGESPPVELYQVNGMARLESGRVAVLDYGDKLLHVFEPGGALAFTVGGEGDGPGEFQGPWGPVVLSGDTILIYDQRHHRFSLFAPDGTLVRDQRLEAALLDGADLFQYTAEDVVGDTVLMIPTAWAIRINDEPGRFTMEIPMLRYRLDGSFVSTMAEPAEIELEQRGTLVRTVTFTRPTRAFARSGRVYVVDPARYEVRMYPHDGELARIYRLERPRRRTTDADVDAYIEHVVESAQDDGAEARIRERMTATARADSFPALSYARVDAGGNVWVSEYRPPWEDARARAWAAFAAEGHFLGRVEIPSGFSPGQIGEDAVLGVLTDELGVQRVVEYRVHR